MRPQMLKCNYYKHTVCAYSIQRLLRQMCVWYLSHKGICQQSDKGASDCTY